MPPAIFPDRIEAVLFDVDGTLVNTVEGAVRGIQDTFVAFGARSFSDEDVRGLMGIPLARQMRIGLGEDMPESVIREAIDYTISRYAVHMAELTLFEPAVAALETCHERGYKTALVTSKNQAEIDHFKLKFRALHCVDTIVCASDVRNPKPSSESGELALARLGADPENAVMIGDSIYDIGCAHSSGIGCVAVSYGATAKDVLQNEQPHVLLETPEALLDWVSTHLPDRHEKENTNQRLNAAR